MASGFELVVPAVARAAIAAHVLPAAADARLGEIVLAPHQVAAARRLMSILDIHGGALLADDVGLGKTFVALAVARHYSHIAVVAPAGLRGMWRQAITRSGLEASVTSYEALSRGPHTHGVPDAPRHAQPRARPGIVILDEAHHARTPTSRRYPRIASLTESAHTVLLTATPLPNRLGDLRSLVALFAGSRAWRMSEAELSMLVCRRTAATVPGLALPPVAPPRWIEIDDDAGCLDALRRLPPPVPPAGSGDAGALLTLGLVRQWASSRAALVAALRRSRARCLALLDAVAAGLLPTAAELRTWHLGEHAMQLGFPELLAAPVNTAVDQQSLACSLRLHADAVARLLDDVARGPDPDRERARYITALRQAHPNEKIVCFTEFAETAAAYWRYLRRQPGVARLSARGGEIASGQLSRDAVLHRFAPEGQRVRKPSRVEDIGLLITTDLLSEGVDLRDATVVVHLDLPWSPARMEQRVGRARRLGSSAASISVYAVRPPAPSEAVLELERRLREKAAVAWRAVGSGGGVLPAAPPGSDACTAAPATATGAIARRPASGAELRSALLDRVGSWAWTRPWKLPGDARDGVPIAAIVPSAGSGWLAAVTVGDAPLLLASLNGETGSDTALLTAACDLAEAHTPARVSPTENGTREHALVERAVLDAAHHAREARALDVIGPIAAPSAEASVGHARTARSPLLARIHRALQSAPPHQAPRIATLAAAARRLVCGRMTAGVEMRLQQLTTTIDDDASWLAAVAELAGEPAAGPATCRVSAIIVFVPATPSPARAKRS